MFSHFPAGSLAVFVKDAEGVDVDIKACLIKNERIAVNTGALIISPHPLSPLFVLPRSHYCLLCHFVFFTATQTLRVLNPELLS